jgi:hypothetical protein
MATSPDGQLAVAVVPFAALLVTTVVVFAAALHLMLCVVSVHAELSQE